MRGCALGALACTWLTPTRTRRLPGRCRFTVIGVTHLHAHTIRPTSDRPDLRRARHSVSLLCAHLVFVTKYRRRVFTDQMLTFCEHTVRAVCAELDVELTEFNGEADHIHMLIAYPPTLAISTLVKRLNRRTAYAVRRRIHRCLCPCPHARTPVVPVLLRRLLQRRTAVDHQAVHRRPSTPPLSAGLPPATNGMGLPRNKFRGLRPRSFGHQLASCDVI